MNTNAVRTLNVIDFRGLSCNNCFEAASATVGVKVGDTHIRLCRECAKSLVLCVRIQLKNRKG
jgi:hypothetical protein